MSGDSLYRPAVMQTPGGSYRYSGRWLGARWRYRLLEIIPGLLVWMTIVLMFVLPFIDPIWMIAFVVVFDLFWLMRILYILVYYVLAFQRYRQAQRTHWLAKVQTIDGWRRIYHVVFIPMATEGYDVIASTFRSLAAVDYPHDRLLVVLATEGRFADQSRAVAERIRQQYGQAFWHLVVTEHPGHIEGEIAGKGANLTWSARAAQRLIDEQRIPYDDIVVTAFDADSAPDKQYFSALSHAFLTAAKPLRTSYQPIPLFHNNVWEALPPMRVVANSTTFWLLGDTMRPDRLLTFSSHSMSFTALADVGFWQTDVVSDDSRIFIQCLLRYDGDYRTMPIYVAVSMDTVEGRTWLGSFVNQYKQIRRWAYGAENLPFMVWNFFQAPRIPLRTKMKYVWNQIEGVYSWATAPLVVLILGWLPFHVPISSLQHSVLAQNAPAVIQALMAASLVGLAITALLSTWLLPKPQTGIRSYHWIVMILQWMLLPVTMIVYGSIPAIDAQTRLMLGRYLGFWVTDKKRHHAE